MARRTGLGKGLGALIPTEATGDSTTALRQVPIADIHPNPLQPRRHFDEAAMSALATSIRQLGVLQPALVRETTPGTFELIAGERRWRAARRAGLQAIPVLVQSTLEDQLSLEQALVENLHREDLNALEEAAAYQQLIEEFGLTHDEVARRVGRSRAAVSNTLRLLQLPAGVQRALAEGTITAGHARALLATPDRSLQETLVSRIVADGLTVRAVEELLRPVPAAPDLEEVVDHAAPPSAGAPLPEGAGAPGVPNAPPYGEELVGRATLPGENGGTTTSERLSASGRSSGALPEPGILELEELLAAYLNTRVKVEIHQRRGRLQIDFATLEDLERIYRVMVGGAAAEGGLAGAG